MVQPDTNDIPLYGNYHITGQGTISLPLNKIAGKFLVFGVRGHKSKKFKETSFPKYNPINNQTIDPNIATFDIFNFEIVQGVTPFVLNDKVKFTTGNALSLVFNNDNIDNINQSNQYSSLENNTSRVFEFGLNRIGSRYYPHIKPLYYIESKKWDVPMIGNRIDINKLTNISNTDEGVSSNGEFPTTNPDLRVGMAIYQAIYSDTVLCVKTSADRLDIQHYDIDFSKQQHKYIYWTIKPTLPDIYPVSLKNKLFFTEIEATHYGVLTDDPKVLSTSVEDVTAIVPYAEPHVITNSIDETKNLIPNNLIIHNVNYLQSDAEGTFMLVSGADIETTNFDDSLGLKPVLTINANNRNSFQFGLNLNVYNYQWRPAGEILPVDPTVLPNCENVEDIQYNWNRIIDRRGQFISWGPTVTNGGWKLHYGLTKLNVLKNFIDILGTSYTNGQPFDYVSTIPNLEAIKFNWSIILPTYNQTSLKTYTKKDKDVSEMYFLAQKIIDAKGCAFGVFPEHIGLRRSNRISLAFI